VLDSLVAGDVVNEIVVDERVKRSALIALDRMLALPGVGEPVSA
jgi:quinolinate synthase